MGRNSNGSQRLLVTDSMNMAPIFDLSFVMMNLFVHIHHEGGDNVYLKVEKTTHDAYPRGSKEDYIILRGSKRCFECSITNVVG